jgi:hypothetical protein
MVNKKIRKNIIGIAIACLFIFNPNISVIDIFPDFIGYIILSLCVARLADINEILDEARVAFTRMIWIDLAKIIAIFWIFGMSVTDEYTSSLLLWSFVFGVFEILFAAPAFSKLFAGLFQIGNYYPNEAILKRQNRLFSKKLRAKNKTERISSFTTVFIYAKAILSFLPELADISNASYDELSSGTVDLYQFIGLLRFFAFVPVLVIGLVWLARMIIYFVSLSKDKALVDALSDTYSNKILPKKGLFIKRGVHISFLILVIACILTVDFRLTVDGSMLFNKINFIPDIIPAILFLIYFIVIKKYSNKNVKYKILSSVFYIIAATASFVCETYFFSEYSYTSIIRNDRALIMFCVMIGTVVLKGIAFCLVIMGVYKMLCDVISQHTGYVLGRENVTEATERQANELHRELKNPIKLMVASSILYAVSDVAYELLIDSFGFMGVVNMICAAVFIIFAVKAQSEILLAVNTKYMLE